MLDVFIFIDLEMLFTGREKAFCVLEYARSQSNKTVHYAFVREFSKQSPTAMQIWTWKKKFKEEGCFAAEKDLYDVNIRRNGRACTQKNLAKTKEIVRGTNLETQILPTTVWHILRKCLIMKPYKLQLIQSITTEDK